MKKSLFTGLLLTAGILLVSATNGYSFGSLGTNVNTTCGTTVYTGDCATCHVANFATSTPAKTAYLTGGTALTDYFCPAPPPAQERLTKSLQREVLAVADFDGDGDMDILDRNATTGGWRMTMMNGDAVLSSNGVALGTSGDLDLVATADFNNDGNADILLRNSNNGKWILNYMAGDTITSTVNLDLPRNMNLVPVAAKDFDGDGNVDILLRNINFGGFYIDLLANGTVLSHSRI